MRHREFMIELVHEVHFEFKAVHKTVQYPLVNLADFEVAIRTVSGLHQEV
jgi:hypothetical protein